ncbi:MAG TPA: ATP-binding protein [Cellvibrionaceae bacterium]|nr:ATP-binding protein [Cellvibrionaceae bacterium]
MNRRIRALIEGLLPHSLFGRLFGLLAIAIVSSHLLFGLQVNLREGHNRPPEGRAPPEQMRPSTEADLSAPDLPRAAPKEPMPARRPPPMRESFGQGFWLGLVGQCLLVLLIARWGSRMLTRPIEQLAAGARALGENLQMPPLEETGPLEVRLAIGGFNQMQSKLKHQLAERSQFLLAVSHDLRTPLTRMRLRYEQLPAGAVQEKLLQDWQDLSRLVDSTLDYVRGQDPQGAPVVVNVESLLGAMVEDRQDLGQAISLEGRAAPISTRPDALRRCLQNLMDNGLAYGGQVQVSLIDSPEQLCIAIRDFGPGIAEADLARVLEPFVRLEASRNRNTGGLGLGLSIARDCARGALGQLSLNNHPEGGLLAKVCIVR